MLHIDDDDGHTQQIRLGRDFALDGELVGQLALIEGIANVSLTARKGADHLRLVA
jgi:DNA polymerase-3 subunit alpha